MQQLLTIEHMCSGCPALANDTYLGGHNEIVEIIQQKLTESYKLLENLPPLFSDRKKNCAVLRIPTKRNNYSKTSTVKKKTFSFRRLHFLTWNKMLMQYSVCDETTK